MFAQTNNQILPIIVVDDKGKRKRAKRVKLVVNDTEKGEAIIQQVKVDLHKK